MDTLFSKTPIVGSPLTPQIMRQINTAIRRYMPIAGNGVRVSRTPGGTIISSTAKNGVEGGYRASMLFPYKCAYSEEEISGSSGSGSGEGDSGSESETRGFYCFYLPEYEGSHALSESPLQPCLNYNGSGVKFDYNLSQKHGNEAEGSPWAEFSDFGFGSSDGTETKLIVCNIAFDSHHSPTAGVFALDQMGGNDSGGFAGNSLTFPICEITETRETQSDSGSGGSGSGGSGSGGEQKVTRTIRQFAIGNQMINDGDNAPFKIAFVNGQWKVIDNVFRLENMVEELSDFAIGSDWGGKYLYLKSGSGYGMSAKTGSLSDLQTDCADPASIVIPLYKFTAAEGSPARFSVALDLRSTPTAQMWMATAIVPSASGS